ncbi:hypothetical protein PMV_275 [Port-miou virus]|uniref:Uncharacterized protein n=1 Tax=Port-miou virus TaxID=1733873 RepID=A0A0N9PVQ0_9VIRU|nr:hypothetical protein PMV_275 [Port-miou virus]
MYIFSIQHHKNIFPDRTKIFPKSPWRRREKTRFCHHFGRHRRPFWLNFTLEKDTPHPNFLISTFRKT